MSRSSDRFTDHTSSNVTKAVAIAMQCMPDNILPGPAPGFSWRDRGEATISSSLSVITFLIQADH